MVAQPIQADAAGRGDEGPGVADVHVQSVAQLQPQGRALPRRQRVQRAHRPRIRAVGVRQLRAQGLG
eukprot:897259-Pyramimonas_sp.AAC.1